MTESWLAMILVVIAGAGQPTVLVGKSPHPSEVECRKELGQAFQALKPSLTPGTELRFLCAKKAAPLHGGQPAA